MVARSISKPRSTFRGILPFDASRDLGAVARLLEEAFRDENAIAFSRVPLMREMGIFMWTLNYIPTFPENISGFVWLEEGRIVGNLTLTRDEGWTDRYFISNVAVKREFRRKGIGRQLVRAAVDELRSHSAHWALLNVRPANVGAIQLYKEFGFQVIEMRGEWLLGAAPRAAAGAPLASSLPTFRSPIKSAWSDWGEIRPLRWSDHRGVVELVRAATPAAVKQFRRQEINPYWLYWEDRFGEILTDFFIGQRTKRWVIERNRTLGALVTIKRQRVFSPHSLEVHVHPDLRGQIEKYLTDFALNQLRGFPARAIRAHGTSTHGEMIQALEERGFKFQNGLTLMTLGF